MRKPCFLLCLILFIWGCAEKRSAVYTASTNYNGILLIKYTHEQTGRSFSKKLIFVQDAIMLELNENEYNPGTHVGYNIRIDDILVLTGNSVPFNGNDPVHWELTSEGTVDKYRLMIDTSDFQ